MFYDEWKLDNKRTDYNIVFDQSLEGELDITRLKNAINRFVSDYIVLDSHIRNKDGNLYWIQNYKKYELEYFNEPQAEMNILGYIQKPFDLENGPLYRFCLIKTNASQYRIIIVLYHIIIDGLSGDYFIDELSKYYNDENYKNHIFIKEQEALINNLFYELSEHIEVNKENSKLFWKKALTKCESLNMNFLSDQRNENKNNTLEVQKLNKVEELRFNFGKEEVFKLNLLKRKFLITPYLYSQAVCALLLHRYTGQYNFCVSYPIAIKQAAHFIYGAHINTNFIPYNFHELSNVLDIITSLKKFTHTLKQGNFNHGYLPISDIIFNADRNILNFSFIQTNLKDTAIEFDGIKVHINNETNIDLSNDLLFEQEVKEGEVKYRVKYKSQIIDTVLLNEFINSYKSLFISILDELILLDEENKLCSIKDYNLLSLNQFSAIKNWSSGKKEDLSNDKLHSLLENIAQKAPKEIAIIYQDITITYEELNNRVNQLARYLSHKYNIRPNTLIGLCLGRNENLAIAILSIWKLGAAYVPINPLSPTKMIDAIIKDANIKLILTNAIHSKNLEVLGINILAIDSEKLRAQLILLSKLNLGHSTSTNDLAYVMYTSCAVGKPKGVMIEHAGVINVKHNLTRAYGLSKKGGEVILQLADYITGTSVEEIILALLNGFVLLMIPANLWLDKDAFYYYLNINNVTHICATPTFLNQYDFNKIPSLRRLISGGELFNGAWYKKIKSESGFKVINTYGTLETSNTSLVAEVDPSNLSIGHPLSNTTVYVLDEYLSLVPIGVVGELYVGGIGVSRGYLNDPKLTAENFIPNYFYTEEEKNTTNNIRLYKTGDRVRWLANGNLEYIGRNDSQIKVRDYRVELSEIENALSSYKKINCCAVIIKNNKTTKHPDSNKLLIGYYVSETKLDERNIINYLEKILPAYMLPYRLIQLESLPLTLSGDINKKILANLDLQGNVISRDKLENNVLKIWQSMQKI